jgi:signal peptidase I
MRTWLKIIAIVMAVLGAVVLVLHVLFFDVWRVPADDPLLTASVAPTLGAGDLVVITRHTWVGRGELLRCTDPDVAGRFVIARAIGRPGEHVELVDEVVSIDGTRTPSPRACDVPAVRVYDPRINDDEVLSCSMEDYGDRAFGVLREQEHPERVTKVTVEPSHWFLVSDDRHVHLDSRDFGQIDPSTCRHVVFRIVSAAGFGDSERRLSIIW